MCWAEVRGSWTISAIGAGTGADTAAAVMPNPVTSSAAAQWKIGVFMVIHSFRVEDSRLARRSAAQSRRRSRSQAAAKPRSEEHTSELQSLMRISYAVFCLKKKKQQKTNNSNNIAQYTQNDRKKP